MMNRCVYLSIVSLMLTACAAKDKACEDVTMAAEQVQACEVLKKQISDAKGRPLVRTELERRYQQDCIDSRYYRDDIQDAICANKQQIEQIKKETHNEKK